VELMHGAISVHSDDSGSTFTVEVPAEPVAAASTPLETGVLAQPTSQPRMALTGDAQP
jgi:hypothetical protein